MRILVACEFSGIVRDAFRALGHDAWSCDLLPCERDPQWHLQGDVLQYLDNGWDLMIAHPPCTYVSAGSMNWLYRESGRFDKMLAGVEFARLLLHAPIMRIALENPIGQLNTRIRKPDQILRVFQFGHPYKKDVCLWLKGLPLLKSTKIVPPPYKTFDFSSKSRKTATGGCRKSITLQGIADAMALQWGSLPSFKGTVVA